MRAESNVKATDAFVLEEEITDKVEKTIDMITLSLTLSAWSLVMRTKSKDIVPDSCEVAEAINDVGYRK